MARLDRVLLVPLLVSLLALMCLGTLLVKPWSRTGRYGETTKGGNGLYAIVSRERKRAEGGISHIRGKLLDQTGQVVKGARFRLFWCCPAGHIDFPREGQRIPEELEGRFDFIVKPRTYSVKVTGGGDSKPADNLVVPDDGQAYVWTVIFQRLTIPSIIPPATPEHEPRPRPSVITITASITPTPGPSASPAQVPPTTTKKHMAYLPIIGREFSALEVTAPEITAPEVTVPEATPWRPRAAGEPVPTETVEEMRRRLISWPRPADDNGMGMHFLRMGYFNPWEADYNIKRLLEMKMKWATVLYSNQEQLAWAAQKFREAGIMVIWRRHIAPYERSDGWERDVEILKEQGMVPYLQLYNEPSLDQEWHERPIDVGVYQENFLDAAWKVHNSGGYVGLQIIDTDWLIDTLRFLKERDAWPILRRMFFVAHCYALNHPPDYTWDRHAAMGFRFYADIFRQEIGFVPPVIVGEGGWYIGAQEDTRWGPVTDGQHRDYHLEVFNWFRRGTLSDGSELPDYLFAFTPWLISDGRDRAAWFDNRHFGERTLTYQAVRALPAFRRRFSWER